MDLMRVNFAGVAMTANAMTRTGVVPGGNRTRYIRNGNQETFFGRNCSTRPLGKHHLLKIKRSVSAVKIRSRLQCVPRKIGSNPAGPLLSNMAVFQPIPRP
jgi:hypothetical protein